MIMLLCKTEKGQIQIHAGVLVEYRQVFLLKAPFPYHLVVHESLDPTENLSSCFLLVI